MSRATALATSGLVKQYPGGGGVHGIDLQVPRGGVYGLVGGNGAGKTTLLSIITGLRRADAGRVQLDVEPDRVAVCPDVPSFEPWLTGLEVVELASALAPVTVPAGRPQRVLQQVGLGDALHRRVGGFSRGMTQRLGLAACLVCEPQLLVVDEPTSALDPAGRADVLRLLADVAQQTTVVLSSHALSEVQRVATTVGVLRAGRLAYQGPVQTLIDQHLRPVWDVRLRGRPDGLLDALRSQPWVVEVRAVGPDALRLMASDLETGERLLVPTLAQARVPVVSVEPVEADLEAAFLALTGAAA